MGATTALVAASATSAASAGYGALVANAQGQQQEALANYNAQVIEHQGRMAVLQGRLAKEQAKHQADQIEAAAEYENQVRRRELRSFLSHQASVYGKRGVTMEGTPELVQKKTAQTVGQDMAMASHNAQVTANNVLWEGEVAKRMGKAKQSIANAEAGFSRLQGTAARQSGRLGAWQSLLGGASQIGSMGLTYSLMR